MCIILGLIEFVTHSKLIFVRFEEAKYIVAYGSNSNVITKLIIIDHRFTSAPT